VWPSDDLGATLLEIRDYPEKKIKNHSSLVNIAREELDASLFQIPPGLKVNPTPDEMPFRVPRKQ